MDTYMYIVYTHQRETERDSDSETERWAEIGRQRQRETGRRGQKKRIMNKGN